MCRFLIGANTMAAGTYNLSIEQGSTWELSLEVDVELGEDFNLTGYTVSSKLAKSHYDESPVTLGTSIWAPNTGGIKLYLSAEQTSLLDPSYEYIYDINIESSGGVVTRLLQGRATISPGVSQ